VTYSSRQAQRIFDYAKSFMDFHHHSLWAKRGGGPGGGGTGPPPKYDFVTGNPYQMPLPQIAKALEHASRPEHKEWFAYRMNHPAARAAVVRTLREREGAPYEEADIHLTNGGFAALSVTMRTIADPGDEIIVITPCFFFYESLIAATGATPVRVPANQTDFDLDLAAIERALTPNTRAIIVNSPSNPSGKIYPPETLMKLAALLDDASMRSRQRIWIISDEAFSRIVYDNRTVCSPTQFYPYSFYCYTWGKTLLAPGERIGYIALPPSMPTAAREEFRVTINMTQVASGWSFPDAHVQYAIPELEGLTIDLAELQSNRDMLAAGLLTCGYDVNVSEGSFFMLARSPWRDDEKFAELLTRWDVFVLPASVAYQPGWFRLGLAVTKQTITGALDGFAAAMAYAKAHDAP
jgi:aspartate aminotransferase